METKYWIITASKDHVKIGVNGGFAQACHGKTSPLKRMKAGDYVIYYSSKVTMGKPDKCQEFTAIGQIKDDTVYQHQMNENFCPSRIDIEFFESTDVSILPLIHQLNFISNKSRWGYPFRWGILEIGQNDFDIIADQMLSSREELVG